AWTANIRFSKEGYPKADAWIVDVPDLLSTLRRNRDRIRRKVRKALFLLNLDRNRLKIRGFNFVQKGSVWIGTPIPSAPLHHSVNFIEFDPLVAKRKEGSQTQP